MFNHQSSMLSNLSFFDALNYLILTQPIKLKRFNSSNGFVISCEVQEYYTYSIVDNKL